MKVLRVARLGGPNIWANFPVLEAYVDLGHFEELPSNLIPGFVDRLKTWLPTMVEHRCSIGERGGFFQRLDTGTWLGHVLEHVTLEIQSLIGRKVGFGRARDGYGYGQYKVAIEYHEESVGRACLETAHRLIMAATEQLDFPIGDELSRLRLLADHECLGPSTRSLIAAARVRGVPHIRLNEVSLVQLGQGSRARRVWVAQTDRTGAIAAGIAQNKDLTRRLLRQVDVPVPQGKVVVTQDAAWEAACELGLPVVVKPKDGKHGEAVAVKLESESTVRTAFGWAQKVSDEVIVEQFVRGPTYRVLTVGFKVVAISRGEYEELLGDGVSTIAQLVDVLNQDPLRGSEWITPLSTLELDPVALELLERQGLSVQSVPTLAQRVLLHFNGDYTTDVTELIHPEVRHHCELAAQVVGLDVCGIDLICEDISRPLSSQQGAIVELNAAPGLIMHLQPQRGTPRPVGELIIAHMFADGAAARLPLVVASGTHGRSYASRLLEQLLAVDGVRLGVATSHGLAAGERRLGQGDHANAASLRRLFVNPRVDALLTELTPARCLDEGLGFECCDVALLTDFDSDYPSEREVPETRETRMKAIRLGLDVVVPGGWAVLPADLEDEADLIKHNRGSVLRFAVSPEGRSEAGRHGEREVWGEGDAVVLRDGASTHRLEQALRGVSDRERPWAIGAIASAWAAGQKLELLAQRLAVVRVTPFASEAAGVMAPLSAN